MYQHFKKYWPKKG